VTLPQVARSFERQKRDAFETEREYRRFLRSSGSTEAQLHYRVALSLLQERVTAKVVKGAKPVTRAEVRRYYARHRHGSKSEPSERVLHRIRVLLESRRQQHVLSRFIERFRARYTAITACADGYVVSECGA